MWLRVNRAQIQLMLGLWLLNRRLDLLEWRFRIQTLLVSR